MTKKAVLLLNLGTPDQCEPADVKRYLRQFLNDPRVIDLPAFIRWPLVNLAIIPFRYKKTAAAYQKIWEKAGSPLSIHTSAMQQALGEVLGEEYQVEYGMRYGSPSIDSALNKLNSCGSITVIPLFPQYSSAATGSAIEELLKPFSGQWNVPEIRIIRDFYNHPGFISAQAELIKQHIAGKNIDQVLFSYHGLPERHINKSECTVKCDRSNACPVVSSQNLYCYRAQCYATTSLLASELGLTQDQYFHSFQSRLGRTPWITPYTDLVLPELIQKGVKNIAIVCPSFVADCLETLEEINIRAREQWTALGGNQFTFIPCVNSSPLWVNALADMVLAK
jgi:ferrochelatase